MPSASGLSDNLLPGVVIVHGASLLVRGIRWTESRYQHRLDERIAAAIDRTDVASESLKRSRMIVQAADRDASEGSGARQPSLAISVPLLQHVVLTEAGSHA